MEPQAAKAAAIATLRELGYTVSLRPCARTGRGRKKIPTHCPQCGALCESRGAALAHCREAADER